MLTTARRCLRHWATAALAVMLAAPAGAQVSTDFHSPPRLDINPPAKARVEAIRFDAGFIETNSGLGVFARGRADYSPSRNPNLTLYAQRLAYEKAVLDAKRRLVQLIDGSSVEARTALAESAENFQSDVIAAMSARTNIEQRIDSVSSGFLAGVVVLSMDDRPERGRVEVALASSPRTLGRRYAVSSQVAYTDSLEEAQRLILEDIAAMQVPPAGGRVITDPMTGDTAWIAFGSAPVLSSGNAKLTASSQNHARRRADLDAQKNLVAMLSGEDLTVSSSMSDEFEEVIRQSDALAATDEKVAVFGENIDRTVAAFADQQTAELVVEGRVPAGSRQVSGFSKSDEWVYHAYVYSARRPALVKGSPDTPAPSREAPPRRASRNAKPDYSTPRSRGRDCPPAKSENASVVRAHGAGPTLDAALQRALRDAVMQINGAALQSSQRYHSEFTYHFDTQGERIDADDESAEHIRVRTGGFVSSYQVVDQGARNTERYVEICAEIPEWSPGWRPGKPTIAVIPFEPPRVSSTEPRPSSPQAIVNTFTSQANSLLIAEDIFRVVDRDTDEDIDRELDRILSRWSRGDMPAQELASIGNLLGADYLLLTVFNEIRFTESTHPIPGRGSRRERRERLSVDASIRIVRTATGEVVAEAPFAQTLGGPELDNVARSEGGRLGPRLLMGARIAARDAAVPAAIEAYRMSEWARQDMVILHVVGDRIVFRAGDAPLRRGQIVTLREPIKGAAVTLAIAEAEIVDIAADGSVTARLLRSESIPPGRIRKGIQCVPQPG